MAVAVGLSGGLAYGMMGHPSSLPGGNTGRVTSGYGTIGAGMMGSSGYFGSGMMGSVATYSGGMMGGYANGNRMMGSGADYMAGMMGRQGGMMSQLSQSAGNRTSYGDYVSIVNYGFYPQTLTVAKGTTVTWVNMDFVQHTVTSGSEQAPTNLFDSHELSHMQSFRYTFNTPGTYTYYCDVHPEMAGTIIVTG